MKRATKTQARKLMIWGGIGYGLSALLSLLTLWRIYGKAGCQHNCSDMSFGFEQTLSHIALGASYISLAVVIAGVVLFFMAKKVK